MLPKRPGRVQANGENVSRATGAVLVFLAACQGPSGTSPDSVPEPLAGAIDLEIGLLEGPDAYVFGRVSGIVQDSMGRIFVSDNAANEIRAFSPAGEFLFSVGREGQGPGELSGPCCLALSRNGDLWARDGGNQRYVGYKVLDDGAEPIATLRMAHSDWWQYAPLAFAPDGAFIDVGHRFNPDGRTELHRFHLDGSGNMLNNEVIEEPTSSELGTIEKGDRTTRLFFPQPYGPRFLLAFGPDGMWASAVSSQVEITQHDPDGTTRLIRGVATEGPPLSPNERASAEERIASYIQRRGGNRSDYPNVPDRKPALASLMFDEIGRLWVSFSTAEGQPARAMVYDRGGNVVGERTWPREINLAFPAWIGRDHAIGIASDSLGVQRLARLQFGN